MTTTTSQFTGSIPEFYDRGLVPYIFSGYAADIAKRIADLKPAQVLELAAGTGAVTRRLRDTLASTAGLVATDLNAPMLEVAKRKFSANDKVIFETADATALPFTDASFDAVACQFGVMFFPDKDRHYREVRRVLKPKGTYLFNVWDQFAFNPFADTATETIGSFFADDPPGFYKTPFGYYHKHLIRASLEAAGFAEISFDIVKLDSEIDDTARFAQGLVFGNPVIEEIKSRGAATPEEVAGSVARALTARFGSPGRMPLQAIVISAQRP